MLRPWNLNLQIDYHSKKAVYLQIADAIISDIQSGRMKKGTALPGSRKLALDLKVNRNTIVEALNVLLNEEWLVSMERKGTFVNDKLPNVNSTKASLQKASGNENLKQKFRINFDDGYPDSAIAPVEELARAYRQLFSRKAKWQLMGYSSEFGDLEFRKAMVQMLNHNRSLHTDENSICITRGSQMAMYLTAQCLVEKGDFIMIENPGYRPAWKAFEKAGAQLLPVQVDQDGLIIEDIINHLENNKNIKAIYTTPHHQYPTTVTLSLQRRLELIELSNTYGFTIIEDDYDNEFHFGYRPILPLASFSELQNFVYVGTMSKVVAPALRIGYLVSNNQNFIKKISDLRKIIDVQGDTIMEQAVLQLIEDGTIKKHLKKAVVYYKSKRDFTEEKLNQYLKDKADYTLPQGGMAFWLRPQKEVNWEIIDQKLQAKGIKIINPENFSFNEKINGLRLSYGSLSKENLEEGIKAISELL